MAFPSADALSKLLTASLPTLVGKRATHKTDKTKTFIISALGIHPVDDKLTTNSIMLNYFDPNVEHDVYALCPQSGDVFLKTRLRDLLDNYVITEIGV